MKASKEKRIIINIFCESLIILLLLYLYIYMIWSRFVIRVLALLFFRPVRGDFVQNDNRILVRQARTHTLTLAISVFILLCCKCCCYFCVCLSFCFSQEEHWQNNREKRHIIHIECLDMYIKNNHEYDFGLPTFC